jgi:hypothetical protein
MISRRLYVSVGLLSASVIAFQLSLMQVLNYVQWSHFSYLIISLALLGFGASGSILSLFREWFTKHAGAVIPFSMMLSGLFMSLTLHVSGFSLKGFDSFLLFNDPGQIVFLALTCLIFLLPFFFAATALGLIYSIHADGIARLYFADLAGSGVGGMLITALLWFLFPRQIPSLIAFLPMLSGLLAFASLPGKTSRLMIVAIWTVVAGVACFPSHIPISEFKALSKTLTVEDAKILLEKSSPYGHIHVVSAPSLRYAPGLSLAWQNSLPSATMVFNNGNHFGAILDGGMKQWLSFYDYTPYALPFSNNTPENVLVLDAGTAQLAGYSLFKGVAEVTITESNAAAISLVRNELAEKHDSLYFHSKLTILQTNSRSYLMSDTRHYDLIYLPDTEIFGGSSGVFSTEENYLLTAESFLELWNKLSEDGMLFALVWTDYPLRAPLRLLNLFVQTLRHSGIKNPSDHLLIIRTWGNVIFLLKKNGFSPDDMIGIRDFCESRFFDVLSFDRTDGEKPVSFNVVEDKFADYAYQIMKEDPKAFVSEYAFDLSLPSDNRPYFSRFIIPEKLKELKTSYRLNEIGYFELGYFFTFLSLAVIIILVCFLIVLPLLFLKIRGSGIPYTLFYFGGLGIGFMFVEIVLIQKFILYLGEPIYSAATVISGMLLISGAGSLFSGRLAASPRSILRLLLIIVPVVSLYTLIPGLVVGKTMHLHVFFKVLWTLALITPPSFFMGMAFPLGIRLLNELNKTLIPWAWGINGCFSVISAVLAILIALHMGFQAVILAAALSYLISAFALAGQKLI